jgi:hypothetical protein
VYFVFFQSDLGDLAGSLYESCRCLCLCVFRCASLNWNIKFYDSLPTKVNKFITEERFLAVSKHIFDKRGKKQTYNLIFKPFYPFFPPIFLKRFYGWNSRFGSSKCECLWRFLAMQK